MSTRLAEADGGWGGWELGWAGGPGVGRSIAEPALDGGALVGVARLEDEHGVRHHLLPLDQWSII